MVDQINEENQKMTKSIDNKKNDRHDDNEHNKKNYKRSNFFKEITKEKEYKERIIDINRISKTVQGGRRMHFSALVVIGDNKGHYGFAIKKSNEVPDAIKKSSEAAHHNVHKIYIIKESTIAHEVIGKYCATKVFLKPAVAGTGIIAGGPVRAILELAGLKNVISKVYGARSSINIIRATHNAICQLKNRRKVNELRGINVTVTGEQQNGNSTIK